MIGDYHVVAANSCASTPSAIILVTDGTPATPTINQTGGTLTSSAGIGNQWYLNGTAISGATGQTYVTTTNGTYTVVVTVNGCPSAISAAANVTNTGITSGLAKMGIEVYPNPASGTLNVKFTGTEKNASVTLFTLTGQQVFSGSIKSGESSSEFDVRTVAAGTYFLRISTEKGNTTSRIVIQ